MKNKNRKSIWFIILAFIFVFSTGQICTGWEGIGNGSDTEQEAGEEENGDEEIDEEEDD